MTPYRIKKHRQRAHHGSHMALVPFIDMLTMLVVFLLLHSSDVEILPNTKNITHSAVHRRPEAARDRGDHGDDGRTSS